jgi:hypothetical protein
MTIDLNDKEVNELAHLRRCADNQNFNIPAIKSFLDGLGRKLAAPAPKRTKKKALRKSHFKFVLDNNIHGNSKKVLQ